MSCFYNSRRDMLQLKCDGCGLMVDLYEGETDRLLKHSYIRKNGWKTTKHNGRWIDICPKCEAAVEDAKREAFVSWFGR